jgi:copper chaperone CopZ
MSARHRYRVNGLTCQHCVRAVTEELIALDPVADVDITLVPGGTSIVEVDASAPLTEAEVSSALEEAGAYALA